MVLRVVFLFLVCEMPIQIPGGAAATLVRRPSPTLRQKR